jgi:urease accessory protein
VAVALQIVSGPVASIDPSLAEVGLSVERLVLAKRLWRGTAADGKEFGFELTTPLKHGDVFWQASGRRYVVQQQPEAVVQILLDVAPSAAAGIGWAVGNLHLELSAESTRLLAPDEPAVRALLERLNVPFKPTTAVFRPGRFARGGLPVQELGASHRH